MWGAGDLRYICGTLGWMFQEVPTHTHQTTVHLSNACYMFLFFFTQALSFKLIYTDLNRIPLNVCSQHHSMMQNKNNCVKWSIKSQHQNMFPVELYSLLLFQMKMKLSSYTNIANDGQDLNTKIAKGFKPQLLETVRKNLKYAWKILIRGLCM